MTKDNISIIHVQESKDNKNGAKDDESEKDLSKGKNSKKNSNTNNTVSYWNISYIFGIVVGCSMMLSTILIIPRHNSIIYQKYWLEVNLAVAFVILASTLNTTLEFVVFIKLKIRVAIYIGIKLYLWTFLPWFILYCLCYIIWVISLGYNHPVPLLGLNVFATWIVSLPGLWFSFPRHLRSDVVGRGKLKCYMQYQILGLLLSLLMNDGLKIIYESLPLNVVWIISIIIPIFRQTHIWIFSKLIHRITGTSHDDMISYTYGILVQSQYVLFVAIRLSTATNTTVLSILIVELILHLVTCFQIVHFKNKIESHRDEDGRMRIQKQNLISKLVMSELVEILVALMYMISIAMAYFGPNGALQINILNDYWGNEKIMNISHVYGSLFILFSMDIGNFLSSLFVLWKFTDINLLQEFCKALKRLWFLFLIILTNQICIYFGNNDINLGMDFTGTFDWISEEGRFKIICNTSGLSIEEKHSLLFNNTCF